MDFTLKANATAEITEVVTEDNTAIKYASGTAPVYATPALVGLMEHAAVKAIGDQLPQGYSTVGISMNIKHTSATPVGMTVKAKAVLIDQDRRRLTFKIEGYDDAGSVGEAVHERFIIEAAPFIEKANAKLKKKYRKDIVKTRREQRVFTMFAYI